MTHKEDAHIIDAEELAAPVVVLKILHRQIKKFGDCPEAIGSLSFLALLWCNLASVIPVQIERYSKKTTPGHHFHDKFPAKIASFPVHVSLR